MECPMTGIGDSSIVKFRAPCDTGGTCIEVAFDGDRVLIRDSKDPDGPVLVFTPAEWVAHVQAVKEGEYDRA
jgi:Domain of unknown function (DUF397)